MRAANRLQWQAGRQATINMSQRRVQSHYTSNDMLCTARCGYRTAQKRRADQKNNNEQNDTHEQKAKTKSNKTQTTTHKTWNQRRSPFHLFRFNFELHFDAEWEIGKVLTIFQRQPEDWPCGCAPHKQTIRKRKNRRQCNNNNPNITFEFFTKYLNLAARTPGRYNAIPINNNKM